MVMLPNSKYNYYYFEQPDLNHLALILILQNLHHFFNQLAGKKHLLEIVSVYIFQFSVLNNTCSEHQSYSFEMNHLNILCVLFREPRIFTASNLLNINQTMPESIFFLLNRPKHQKLL